MLLYNIIATLWACCLHNQRPVDYSLPITCTYAARLQHLTHAIYIINALDTLFYHTMIYLCLQDLPLSTTL